MGRDEFQARGAVRFSLGRFTTVAEIDYVIAAVGAAVRRLRDLSPLWELRQRGLDQYAVDWAALP
jgi:cysteine desulfurase